MRHAKSALRLRLITANASCFNDIGRMYVQLKAMHMHMCVLSESTQRGFGEGL